MKDYNKMIEAIQEAYITVMGVEKWNSLSDKEKHDAVMTICGDMMKAVD